MRKNEWCCLLYFCCVQRQFKKAFKQMNLYIILTQKHVRPSMDVKTSTTVTPKHPNLNVLVFSILIDCSNLIYNYLSPSVIYVNICWFIEQPGLFPNCVNVFGFVWLGSSISHISFDPHVKLTIFPLIKSPSPKFQRNNPQMSCQMQNSPDSSTYWC